MSVDQAIADALGASGLEHEAGVGESTRPTLRFYTWADATLSLGYFQSAQAARPRFDALSSVRRSTGGGAILHHHELTYSLTVPCRPGEHGARTDLYRMVHRAIANELRRLGATARPYHLDKRSPSPSDLFLCFQRRTDEDLIVSGYKVCGSAQRRSKRALLQHGSILLRASCHANELPGISDLTSIPIDIDSLARGISGEIGHALGVSFVDGGLSPWESKRADEVVRDRFGAEAWWARR